MNLVEKLPIDDMIQVCWFQLLIEKEIDELFELYRTKIATAGSRTDRCDTHHLHPSHPVFT
jgi:hypothetical protein